MGMLSAARLSEHISFRGESRTLAEWASHLGFAPTYLHEKIRRLGVEAALSQRAGSQSAAGRRGSSAWRRLHGGGGFTDARKR